MTHAARTSKGIQLVFIIRRVTDFITQSLVVSSIEYLRIKNAYTQSKSYDTTDSNTILPIGILI